MRVPQRPTAACVRVGEPGALEQIPHPSPSAFAVKMKEVVGFPSIVDDTEAWVEFVSDESNVDAMVEALNTE